ncbi:MAG: GNAT family N-acetyltransferase, partial [Sedimenticolaceae bacterium]
MAHNILPRQVVDFSFQVIVARSLQPQTPAPPELPGLRVASIDDAELLGSFGTSPSTIRGRFHSGYKAWLIEREGQPIACDWLGPDNCKSRWEWLIMQGRADDIWHEYFEVAQKARGQGLGPKMRTHVIFDCQQREFKRLLGNVEMLNRRSMRAMQ